MHQIDCAVVALEAACRFRDISAGAGTTVLARIIEPRVKLKVSLLVIVMYVPLLFEALLHTMLHLDFVDHGVALGGR
jgi:hypothetical protein